MRNILLLTILLFWIPGSILKAEIFYVGAKEKYKMISGVMYDVSPGDTIIVRDGVYDKSIDIRSPLTLMAENRHKAIIGDGIGTEGVFKVKSNNVVIDGFKFMDNPEWPGIAIGGFDSSMMVTNCKILNNDIINRKFGIRFSTFSKSCLVDSNIITGSTENGIIHAGEGHTITNNRIEGSRLCGILVFEISKGPISILGNTIRLNISHGIEIRCPDITLKGNHIVDNTEFGVYTLSDLKNIILSDSNRIENNGMTGILIKSRTEANIQDNIIKGNMDSGIEIDQSGKCTIRRNIIKGNESYGILNNGAATIYGNTISESKINGVEIRPEATKTLLVNNTISDNTENGVFQMGNADFTGNTISGNGFMGILIAEAPRTTNITGNNQIISNGEHGVIIGSPCNAIITNNTISGNGTSGIEGQDFGGLFIEGSAIVEANIIEDNFDSGIKVEVDANNVFIRYNRVINGNRAGIRLNGPATVLRNSINNNIKQGILVTASDSCEISEDTLSGNSVGIVIGRSSTSYTSVYNCDIRNNKIGILSYGEVKIRRSTIENNADRGIIIREKGIDMGQQNSENGGYNTIRNNAIWNMVNETPDTVMACYNYWTFSDSVLIDSTIRDNEEDNLFGPVIFSPFLTHDITGMNDRFSDPAKKGIEGLLEIYPNPFMEKVNFNYRLAAPGRVTLTIMDMMGRTVSTPIRNEYHEPGPHTIKWDALTGTCANIKPGIYVIVLTMERNVSSRIIQFLH